MFFTTAAISSNNSNSYSPHIVKLFIYLDVSTLLSIFSSWKLFWCLLTSALDFHAWYGATILEILFIPNTRD